MGPTERGARAPGSELDRPVGAAAPAVGCSILKSEHRHLPWAVPRTGFSGQSECSLGWGAFGREHLHLELGYQAPLPPASREQVYFSAAAGTGDHTLQSRAFLS